MSDDTICNASGIKLLYICKNTDVRIVNGRIGDESGRYTFLANTGTSVIDYAIVSCTLFPIIENVIVHEYFSCSANAPIQVTFNINCDITHVNDVPIVIDKLIWNDNKVNDFREHSNNQTANLQSIVSDIISQELNIDKGIDTFSNVLYKSAFHAFGVTKQTSPWYTSECEVARRELKFANKQYKHLRTDDFSKLVLGNYDTSMNFSGDVL